MRLPLLAARLEEGSVEDWQHIDDVCQRTIGSDPADVCSRSIRAGIAFAESAEGRGLTIASKSVVVSTSPKIAEFVTKEFREAGYDVGAAGSTEMLGVRTQLAGKRDLATAKDRWVKFKARVQRISMLSKVTKQAARLFTSHVSVATYGGGSIGTDPKQQRLLTQAGAKAAGKHGFQACPTSVCALAIRILPSVQQVVKLFTWWIRWYRELVKEPTVPSSAKLGVSGGMNSETSARMIGGNSLKGPTQALIAHMFDWVGCLLTPAGGSSHQTKLPPLVSRLPAMGCLSSRLCRLLSCRNGGLLPTTLAAQGSRTGPPVSSATKLPPKLTPGKAC